MASEGAGAAANGRSSTRRWAEASRRTLDEAPALNDDVSGTNLGSVRAQRASGVLAKQCNRPPTVGVVIPTLNEADNLRRVLPSIPAWVDELIIVDGGSTDGTIDVVRQIVPRARVLRQASAGKGAALIGGFEAAESDIIVMLDGDGSTDPTEIPRFVAALRTGADFAKGTRFAMGGGSSDITRLRRWGNRALTRIVNFIWHIQFTDLCYGYNAFWRSKLPTLALDCRGFELETLLNIRAASHGLRIVEVPSYESSRLFGVSNLQIHRDGMRVMRTILAEWIRPR